MTEPFLEPMDTTGRSLVREKLGEYKGGREAWLKNEMSSNQMNRYIPSNILCIVYANSDK